MRNFRTLLPIKLCPFDAVEVDTEYTYQLALDNQPLILTRPRRFGKSTLLSTLEELFLHGVEPYDGHDSYFKGLAIEDKWHDQNQYLVLRLNFQNINRQCKTAAQFEQKLILRISEFCQKQQLVLPEKLLDFSMYLEALLEQLSYGSLVLLVDEYDAPLVRHLNDEAELKAYQELLEALFGLVKDWNYPLSGFRVRNSRQQFYRHFPPVVLWCVLRLYA